MNKVTRNVNPKDRENIIKPDKNEKKKNRE